MLYLYYAIIVVVLLAAVVAVGFAVRRFVQSRRMAYWKKHVEPNFKEGKAFCFVQIGSSSRLMSVWNGYITKEDYAAGRILLQDALRVVTANCGRFWFESDYVKNYGLVSTLAVLDSTARVVFDTNEFPDKAFRRWLNEAPEGETAHGRLTMMV